MPSPGTSSTASIVDAERVETLTGEKGELEKRLEETRKRWLEEQALANRVIDIRKRLVENIPGR